MLHALIWALPVACLNAGIAGGHTVCWVSFTLLAKLCILSKAFMLVVIHATNSRWDQCLLAGLSKAKFVDQYLSQKAGQGAFSQDVVCHVSIGVAALVGMVITMLLAEQNLRLDTKQLMAHSRQHLDWVRTVCFVALSCYDAPSVLPACQQGCLLLLSDNIARTTGASAITALRLQLQIGSCFVQWTCKLTNI